MKEAERLLPKGTTRQFFSPKDRLLFMILRDFLYQIKLKETATAE